MNGKKHSFRRKNFARLLAMVLAAAMLLALPAMAYDRQEATVATGGTEVTVYKGTQNSNDQGNYLADPGDYEAFNRFWTPGKLESTSNITSSTNFVKEITPDGYTVRGGVEGVSWDAATGTLTLNNASGTVITIEGPSIDPTALNTYNDKLTPVIDYNMPNLTYFKQFDLFIRDGQAAAPHTKDNSTVQDTVTVNIVGQNSFNNIRLTGNVKVVFTGTGTLALNAVGSWNYDNYSEPWFDVLSHPASYAISSYPTIGYQGSLEGEAELVLNNGGRVLTENYAYALPEIVLDGVEIAEGGSIFNTAQVTSEDYLVYGGSVAPTDESKIIAEAPAGLNNSAELRYNGGKYTVLYNDAKDTFLTSVTSGRGANAVTTYYDLSADVTVMAPWESFIGAEGTPAQKVVIREKIAIEVSKQKLTVDGEEKDVEKYNINDENYVKLRDLAMLLNGTPVQFNVTYDEALNAAVITAGVAYEPVGGELAAGADNSASAQTSSQTIRINGSDVTLKAYNIGGYNFFRLRDLDDYLGFAVDYDEESNTASVSTAPEAVKSYKALGFVDADGAKVSAIAIEYDTAIDAASVSLDDYEVIAYSAAVELGSDPGKPTKIYVNDEAATAETGKDSGAFVIIELNTDYQLASTPTFQNSMSFSVRQVGEITGADGPIAASNAVIRNYTVTESTGRNGQIQQNNTPIEGTYTLANIEGFELHSVALGNAFHATDCYSEADGELHDVDLAYSIFVPADYSDSGKYAFVVQLHDGGATGIDPMIALTKGQGAANFASDEMQNFVKEQGLDGIIVLVPQFSGGRPNDNYSHGETCFAILQLIDSIIDEYPAIDMNRIYGSGQSMGSMMLLAMATYRDNFFAALWEHGSLWGNNYDMDKVLYNGVQYMSIPDDYAEANGIDPNWRNYYYQISDDNILNTDCTEDKLGYSAWTELYYLYQDIGGVTIPKVFMDPLADTLDEQNAKLKELLNMENEIGIYWQAFEGGNHMSTWIYSHKLDEAYYWLLRQTKETEDARGKIEELNRPWAAETDPAKIAAKQTEDRIAGTYEDGTPGYLAVPAEGSGTIGYNSGLYQNNRPMLQAPGWTVEKEKVLVAYLNEELKGIYGEPDFDQYFEEGNAKDGVEALLNAGKVTVNGIPVPAEAGEYTMNGRPALWQLDNGKWTWEAHDNLNADRQRDENNQWQRVGVDTFEEARQNFMNSATQLYGTTTEIVAEDGGETATAIRMFIYSAAVAERFTEENGTVTVWGSEVAADSLVPGGLGPNAEVPLEVPSANFDSSIEPGDTVIYWYADDGWHMQRGIPETGYLHESSSSVMDHIKINLSETPGGEVVKSYRDCLILRLNLQSGSRPRQLMQAIEFFELRDIPITVWNTPTEMAIGISHMGYAREALQGAIDFVEALPLVVSEDGTGVEAGKYWVPQAAYDTFQTAFNAAKAVLANADALNSELDQALTDLGSAYGGRNGLSTSVTLA